MESKLTPAEQVACTVLSKQRWPRPASEHRPSDFDAASTDISRQSPTHELVVTSQELGYGLTDCTWQWPLGLAAVAVVGMVKSYRRREEYYAPLSWRPSVFAPPADGCPDGSKHMLAIEDAKIDMTNDDGNPLREHVARNWTLVDQHHTRVTGPEDHERQEWLKQRQAEEHILTANFFGRTFSLVGRNGPDAAGHDGAGATGTGQEAGQTSQEAVPHSAVWWPSRHQLEQRLVTQEHNPLLQSLPATCGPDLELLYARLALVQSHPAAGLWCVFWHDVWQENKDILPMNEAIRAALDPEQPMALIYYPMPRQQLESVLGQLGLKLRPWLCGLQWWFTDTVLQALYDRLEWEARQGSGDGDVSWPFEPVDAPDYRQYGLPLLTRLWTKAAALPGKLHEAAVDWFKDTAVGRLASTLCPSRQKDPEPEPESQTHPVTAMLHDRSRHGLRLWGPATAAIRSGHGAGPAWRPAQKTMASMYRRYSTDKTGPAQASASASSGSAESSAALVHGQGKP